MALKIKNNYGKVEPSVKTRLFFNIMRIVQKQRRIQIIGRKKDGRIKSVHGKAKNKLYHSVHYLNSPANSEYNTVKQLLEAFMDNITRGRLIQQGNLMRMKYAFVEEASCVNNSVGNILISYSSGKKPA